MREDQFRTISLLKALASPVRYEIILILAEEEKTVSELAYYLEKRIQVVSQHLRILREEHLVRYRTQNKQVFYRLKNKKILEILEILNNFVKRSSG